MATTIIIIESIIIFSIFAFAFMAFSKNSLVNKTDLVRTNEALIASEKALKNSKKSVIELSELIKSKDIQINLLRTERDQLYSKIHNKPKDVKGKFCRKEQLTDGANN